MEYNQPSQIVKDLNFGDDGKNRIMSGVDKLAKAVKSTLGASGKCVIYEDAMGRPVITKDGVTVAQSVVLYDPVENIGATLMKEAAKKTVKDAGNGTTTATVLAHSLSSEMQSSDLKQRDIKNGKDYFKSLLKIGKKTTSTEASFQFGLTIGEEHLSRYLPFYDLYKKTLSRSE